MFWPFQLTINFQECLKDGVMIYDRLLNLWKTEQGIRSPARASFTTEIIFELW